jgi:hypothetical protein
LFRVRGTVSLAADMGHDAGGFARIDNHATTKTDPVFETGPVYTPRQGEVRGVISLKPLLT